MDGDFNRQPACPILTHELSKHGPWCRDPVARRKMRLLLVS